MIAKLRIITKDTFESTSLLNSTTYHRPFNHEIKLPRIELPTFDGAFADWIPFYDAFTAMVDSNASLSELNKMHYLKCALKGTALKAIGNVQATKANTKAALRTLKERFNNKRAIVNSCLKSLLFQSKMQRANATEIRTLIDTTKEATQTLESLSVTLYEWDPILVFIVQTKMDIETLKIVGKPFRWFN